MVAKQKWSYRGNATCIWSTGARIPVESVLALISVELEL